MKRCTALRQDKKLHPSILQRESNISSVIFDRWRWRTKIRLKCSIVTSRLKPAFFSGGDSYQALALGTARQNTHCFWSRRGFAAQSDLLGWEGIKSQGNENNLERCDLHLRLSQLRLKCCVVRNYCLLWVLATSFFTFKTKERNLSDNRVLLLEGWMWKRRSRSY